jgi:hypothetical protein
MENNHDRHTWQKEFESSIIKADHVTLEKLVESPYFSPEMMITDTTYNRMLPQFRELSLLKFLTFSSSPELDVLKTVNILCNKGCTILVPTDMLDTLLSPFSTAQSEKIFTFLVKQIKQNENSKEYTTIGRKILENYSLNLSLFLNLSTQTKTSASLLIDLHKTYKPNTFYKEQRKKNSEHNYDNSTILHLIMVNHCMVIAQDDQNLYTHLYNEQKKKMAFFICQGEDPYVKNAMGHTFFDVKNLCISLIKNEINLFSFFAENPEADKVGAMFGCLLGIVHGSTQRLNDDQKNVIIANINEAYPSIEQITNLAAYYGLNGYFPDEKNSIFQKPTGLRQSLINREYNINKHNNK